MRKVLARSMFEVARFCVSHAYRLAPDSLGSIMANAAVTPEGVAIHGPHALVQRCSSVGLHAGFVVGN